MVTVEYKNGIFYVDNQRITFPKDSQHQSAPCMMGLDYNTGALVPAAFGADGKMQVGGITLTGATIELGAVEINGRNLDTGWQQLSVLDDGFGRGAMFVQSNTLATAVSQTAILALLTQIDNSLHSQINTPTSLIKAVLDTISATLTSQLDTKTSDLYTALGVIDVSINAQVDMKTSILGAKLDAIDASVGVGNTTLASQLDIPLSVLNASVQLVNTSLNTQVDTKTSVLDASLIAIKSSIDTQVDTKTSVLDASLATINTNVLAGNTALATINTTLGALTDATQKTQIVDGAGAVMASTANALHVHVASGITLEVNLDQANDSVAVWGNDGSANKVLKTNAGGQLEVVVISSALPAGASTEATLLLTNTALATVNTNLTTINTTLGTIKTDTTAIASSVASVDGKLDGLTDGNQETKVVNDSGQTIGIEARPIFIDDGPMGKQNIHSVYTYVPSGFGVGKTQTIKEYPTGASGGTPAKLTTYTYNANNKVSAIVVSDTTV